MRRSPVALAALALATGTILACGGGGIPDSRNPDRPLPDYGGHLAELFDDGIEPTAMGYPSDTTAGQPNGDTRLRERTQVGDAVVRAKVTTVTSKNEDRGRSWQLGLHTVERLAGTGFLEKDFLLAVDPTDAASGILKGFEARLIGQSFVVFVREFRRPKSPGDSDLHFHLAADSPDEIKAVKDAVLLDKVK
jgi:hypothetical protein